MRDKSLGVRVSVKRRKRPDQATASLPQCVVVEVPSGETEKVSKVKKEKESEDWILAQNPCFLLLKSVASLFYESFAKEI
jgi:hypothetical protein